MTARHSGSDGAWPLCRCARCATSHTHLGRAADKQGLPAAHGQAADVCGVEAVHVFVDADGVQHCLLVYVLGQRQLDQDAVDLWCVVDTFLGFQSVRGMTAMHRHT